MRSTYPKLSISRLCRWFGISKQAYYQHNGQLSQRRWKEELVLKEVGRIRKDHPKMGGRKLYAKLHPFFEGHQIKLGRDGLFDILSAHKLLIKRRKRKNSTTQSRHRYKKYENLIKDFVARAPNQLWVSDITYWRVEQGFYYISFITDAYSRKIVGYHVGDSLGVVESLAALEMALRGLPKNKGGLSCLIHHSDRGIQYCSKKYVKLLQDNGIRISMTQDGDPLDNAIAERVNGIIKGEYLEELKVENLEEAKSYLREKIALYNQDRPHMSISNLTPEYVHESGVEVVRKWKNYYQSKSEKSS